MQTARTTVIGVFDSERQAREVVEDLLQQGFARENVHLSSTSDYTGDVAAGGAGLTGRATSEHRAGGFMGWLGSIFGTDDTEQNTRYAEAIRRGRCVVAVDTADDTANDRAVDIMNDHNAIDVDDDAARHGYRTMDTGSTSERLREDRKTEESIPVVREELQVGKRVIQRGGVRVFSRVVEEPVEENVRLREEKVRVDRQPANRPVTDADRVTMRDQTIEVTEFAEEPVIQKQARVVEEVHVGKDVTERTETIRDTVRHTEVETENIGAGSRAQDYSDDFRRDFQTRYGRAAGSYETYAPAYEYGYRMGNDPRYTGKTWHDVESTLKTDYLRNNPNSTWDQVKGAIRYGWEKVTGKR